MLKEELKDVIKLAKSEMKQHQRLVDFWARQLEQYEYELRHLPSEEGKK
jgi:hypothetical protein